jgi:hypothetical protein
MRSPGGTGQPTRFFPPRNESVICQGAPACLIQAPADLILHRSLVTTLNRSQPTASAIAIKDGKCLRVGQDREVMALAGPRTRIIDLPGRRVLPGRCDNRTHVIRGGLKYNMEVRWCGVRSLAHAMDMLKRVRHRALPPALAT